MNLYLVLAIALGAISGAVDAPVARPVLSTRAARRGGDAVRRAVRNRLATPISASPVIAFLRSTAEWRRPFLVVASARPRAPALA